MPKTINEVLEEVLVTLGPLPEHFSVGSDGVDCLIVSYKKPPIELGFAITRRQIEGDLAIKTAKAALSLLKNAVIKSYETLISRSRYGIAMERIWAGDILVIEHGRVCRITVEEMERAGGADKIIFPPGINDLVYNVQKADDAS